MSITRETRLTYACDDPTCISRTQVDVTEAELVAAKAAGDEEAVIVSNLPIGWSALVINVVGRCGVRTVTACTGLCLTNILKPEQPNGVAYDLHIDKIHRRI